MQPMRCTLFHKSSFNHKKKLNNSDISKSGSNSLAMIEYFTSTKEASSKATLSYSDDPEITLSTTPDRITPLSTPDQIASRLLWEIETIVDEYCANEGLSNSTLSNKMKNLYESTVRNVLGYVATKSEPQSMVLNDKMKQTVKIMSARIKDQVDAERNEIKEELERTKYPAIRKDVENLQEQMKEMKSLLDANPKLLEDSIVSEAQIFKHSYALFGCHRLTIPLPDKIVVVQKAVKSQTFKRYCEYQDAIRNLDVELHGVDELLVSAMNDGYPSRRFRDPRVTLFGHRCTCRLYSLHELQKRVGDLVP